VLYIRQAITASEPASSISATYTDTFNSGGSSTVRTSQSKACQPAVLNISQRLRGVTVTPTQDNVMFSSGVLQFRVKDEARNANGLAEDVTEISILTLDGSDSEVVVMRETGNNTSVFTGVIGVDGDATHASSQDGALGPFSSRVRFLWLRNTPYSTGVCCESSNG
jgi:hypothetical protein